MTPANEQEEKFREEEEEMAFVIGQELYENVHIIVNLLFPAFSNFFLPVHTVVHFNQVFIQPCNYKATIDAGNPFLFLSMLL